MSNQESSIKESVRLEDPRHKFEDLVTTQHIIDEINELIDEEPYADAMTKEGIKPRRMILLHGPSGCGKTAMAHALAHATKMKLAVAPVSEQRDSLFGESEKRTSYVMKIGNMNRCVLLMDEFDSIASSRSGEPGTAAALNSNMVNVLLQEMESHPPKGYLVACTNFIDRIDPAILRRFDVIIEIPMIDRDGLLELAKRVLNGRFGITPEEVVQDITSPAIITKRANDLIRKKVIEREKKREEEIDARMNQDYDKIQKKLRGENGSGQHVPDPVMRGQTELGLAAGGGVSG